MRLIGLAVVLTQEPKVSSRPSARGCMDLGWVEGRNIAIEYRWAEERTERLPDLARNLAALKVEVLPSPRGLLLLPRVKPISPNRELPGRRHPVTRDSLY
jgi:hypothetical protein